MKQIFRVPMRVYDISSGTYRTFTRYFDEQPLDACKWTEQMLKAQGLGRRLSYSNEWSNAQKYLFKHNSEQEQHFIDTIAWTGTVLDFDDETLKEGIILNDDGTIAESRTVLRKKDGILLPHSSEYIKDLDDRYMMLISKLHGLKNPKRDLPDYAYLWVEPNGFRPVVRGHWHWRHRDDGRVDVNANYDPASRSFVARLVDEKRPSTSITKKEYERRQSKIEKLQDKLFGSTIII